MVKFRKSVLQRLRLKTQDRRGKWERFVLIRVNATEAACMFPRICSEALLLLDRHYNSLKPYRCGEVNLYAVLRNRTWPCAMSRT